MSSQDYLLATIREGGRLPAFAELFFLDQIGEMGTGALNHITHTLSDRAQRRGDVLSVLHPDNVDLMVMLVSVVMQWKAVTNNDASIAESTYGLRRVNLKQSNGVFTETKLTDLQQKLSILSLSVAPYCFSRLERFAARQRAVSRRGVSGRPVSGSSSATATNVTENNENNNGGSNGNNSENNNNQTRYQKFMSQINKSKNAMFLWILKFHRQINDFNNILCLKFGQIYPIFKGIYKLLVFSYKFSYLLGFTSHVHPILAVLDITLIKNRNNRSSENYKNGINTLGATTETENIRKTEIPTAGNGINTANSGGKNVSTSLSVEAKSAIFVGILMSIRVFEFLLRTEGPSNTVGQSSVFSVFNIFNRNTSTENGVNENENNSVPEIPKSLEIGRGCVIPPTNNCCPLCRKRRVNPCASTGGYVFCYLCLFNFIKDSPHCPVTGISCTENDILRLFEDNNDGN